MVEVLDALPAAVLADLMDDPGFTICDYEPGNVLHVPMQLGACRPGRAVVLKRTLRTRPLELRDGSSRMSWRMHTCATRGVFRGRTRKRRPMRWPPCGDSPGPQLAR